MGREYSIFVDFIKQKNLKLTTQREEILNTFLSVDKHMSVEELYDIVKKKDPSVGQATVFRTMKLLCEAGIAREVNLGDRLVRYEHEYGHKHHDHLVCVECGNCIEAVDPEIEKLQDALCKKFGFTPNKHKMEIFGVCKSCKGKQKRR